MKERIQVDFPLVECKSREISMHETDNLHSNQFESFRINPISMNIMIHTVHVHLDLSANA